MAAPAPAPFQLQIPVSLRKILLDDWELVTKKELYTPLPRNPNVNEILKGFCERYKKELPEPFATEMVDGLRTYFTQALPVILCYAVERDDLLPLIQRHGGDACQVLGAEHLLRLFVRLPDILPLTELSPEARDALQAALNLFLKFLDSKKSSFFTKDYAAIGPDGVQVKPEPAKQQAGGDGGAMEVDGAAAGEDVQ